MPKRFSRIPPPPPDEALLWTAQVDPEQMGYVNAVIEAHEGMGYVRTLDRKAGLLEIQIMPGFETDFDAILGGLAREAGARVVRQGRVAPCKL